MLQSYNDTTADDDIIIPDRHRVIPSPLLDRSSTINASKIWKDTYSCEINVNNCKEVIEYRAGNNRMNLTLEQLMRGLQSSLLGIFNTSYPRVYYW